MKRATAILLLIIMSFTSVQTTYAFHFCGGNLRSISMADSQNKTCCGNSRHAEPEDLRQIIDRQEKPCCLNYLISVSTDDCSVSQQQQIPAAGTNHLLIPVLFLPHSMHTLNVPEEFQDIQHLFPPGGLAESGVDLLTFICIFRI